MTQPRLTVTSSGKSRCYVSNFPYSVAFNGSSQFGTTTSNISAYQISTLTIEAWIKPLSLSGEPMIWSFLNDVHYGLEFENMSPCFEYLTYSGSANSVIPPANACVVGVWYHIVVTVSTTGTGSTATVVVNIYLNGVLIKSASTSSGWYQTYGTSIIIAAYTATLYQLNGEIAQLTFYNVALTQAQVTARYNNLTPAQLGITPVSQLNMTEGSGTTLHDAYGNSNFTLTGSPIWTADSPGKSRIIIPKMRTRLPGIRKAA
jgi:hypothetical protein